MLVSKSILLLLNFFKFILWKKIFEISDKTPVFLIFNITDTTYNQKSFVHQEALFLRRDIYTDMKICKLKEKIGLGADSLEIIRKKSLRGFFLKSTAKKEISWKLINYL